MWLNVKPWPNGVTSRRKFSTCFYLQLGFATPCVHLHWLPLTLVEIKFAPALMCSSPFGHPTNVYPTQVSASWVTPTCITTSYKPMKYTMPWNGFFVTFVYLQGNLQIVWPPNAKFYASSTGGYLRHETPCKSWMAIFSCHQYLWRTLLHLSVNRLV